MIFPGYFVQLPVLYENLHPVTFLVGKSSLFSFFTIVVPSFFGTTCTGLTPELSVIG